MSNITSRDKVIVGFCLCIMFLFFLFPIRMPDTLTEQIVEYEIAKFTQKQYDTNIQCHLSIEQTGTVIIAELTFVNHSKETVRVHKWILIENGEMTSSEFNVTRDSVELDYHCMMIKRGPPAEVDMRSLQPGVPFITRTIISECYDFSLKGTYQIFYHSYFPFLDEGLEVKSNVITIMVL